jgi:hypothetical protein
MQPEREFVIGKDLHFKTPQVQLVVRHVHGSPQKRGANSFALPVITDGYADLPGTSGVWMKGNSWWSRLYHVSP